MESTINDVVFEAIKVLGEGSKAWTKMGWKDMMKFAHASVSNLLVEGIIDNPRFKQERKWPEDQTRKAIDTSDCVSPDLALKELKVALRMAPTKELQAEVLISIAKLNMSISKYSMATRDLENAKDLTNQSNIKFRIHHKLAQCYVKLGDRPKALKSLEQAKYYLNKSPDELDKSTIKKFNDILITSIKTVSARLKDILQKEKEMDRAKTTGRKQTSFFRAVESPERELQEGKIAKVVQCRTKGRYLIATSDIKCGDLILAEHPEVALLNPTSANDVLEYCNHCLKKLVSALPCLNCTSVLYCSKRCLDDSQAYHQWECELDLFRYRRYDDPDSFRVFLSLRALFLKFPEDHFLEDSRMFCLDKMVAHEEIKTLEDYIKFSVLTILLLLFVRKTNYLTEGMDLDEGLTEIELRLAKVINHLIQVQSYNTHPVLLANGSNIVEVSRIGNVINAVSGSVMNHSCNANTIRINCHSKSNGKLLTVFIACQNISKGETISDIYSMHYSKATMEVRQEFLRSKFRFECDCQPCLENWTLASCDMDKTSELYKELSDNERIIASSLKAGDYQAAIQVHIKDLDLLTKHVKQPHPLYVSLQNSLEFCYWKLLEEGF